MFLKKKSQKIEEIMEKIAKNDLAFFTKKENCFYNKSRCATISQKNKTYLNYRKRG